MAVRQPPPRGRPRFHHRLLASIAPVALVGIRPLLAATALVALLAACGASTRRANHATAGSVVAPRAATISALLVHVLPGARLITAVDLDAARRELGLPRDQSLVLPGDHLQALPRQAGAASASAAPPAVRTLTQLASLALPLIDDRPLLAALDLRRVHAAVQFGGVEHGGLLIATSQPMSAIAAALERNGWRAVPGGGFEYAGDTGTGLLPGSRVALFAGGLVLAADSDDAVSAAEQQAAPEDDARLLALLNRSRAPARFAAVRTGCLRGILADERLVPHVGTVSLRPRRPAKLSDVVLVPGDPVLSGLGLLVSAPVVRGGRVIVHVRYRNSSDTAAGALVDIARTEPVYRCD
jgi:hypothetical protein